MKTLKFFRKPYFAYLMGFMLLFVSCKQYDMDNDDQTSRIIDFEKSYQKITKINNLLITAGIKDFKNINEVKSKLLKLNTKDNDNITETDIDEAYIILNDLGYFDESLNYYDKISNSVEYAYTNNLISDLTKDFLINSYSNISGLSNFQVDIDNFINSNNLNTNELNLLYFIKNNSSQSRMSCKSVGVLVGIGVSILIGTVSCGIGAAIAGSIFAAAEAQVAEGICEQM